MIEPKTPEGWVAIAGQSMAAALYAPSTAASLWHFSIARQAQANAERLLRAEETR